MKRLAIAAALLFAGALPVAAADSPVADFTTAWAAVDNYTVTITVHETDGKTTADNVYHYAYKKPHFAKIDTVSGPGRGSGAVWTGGDHVSGHQGGLFSGIKLSVPIDDKRAISLRGDTIDYASFQSVADQLKSGKVDPATTEATIAGAPVDVVTIVPAAAADGVTRVLISLSRTTHLPLRRAGYVGDQLVKSEDFSDVKLNPGLTEGDFH